MVRMERRELYVTAEGEPEILDKDSIVSVLTFHQYLCNHMLNTLDSLSHNQEVRERLMKRTIKHLRRMGSTFLRYLDHT